MVKIWKFCLTMTECSTTVMLPKYQNVRQKQKLIMARMIPNKIIMGRRFMRFPNGACLPGLLSWFLGHLMPWRPRWDMAFKKSEVRLAHGGPKNSPVMLGFQKVRSQQSPSIFCWICYPTRPTKNEGWRIVPRTSQPPVVAQAGVLVANE